MRHPNTKAGRYEVTQLIHDGTSDEMRTDFDAEHWAYDWLDIRGVSVLQMYEINMPPEAVSYSVHEFSLPVNIKFVPAEEA